MSWDEYWYGDVWMVESYREAERLRTKQFNAQAHLIGAYIYEAICCVAPVLNAFAKKGTKPVPYRAKPFQLFEEEEETVATEKKAENEKILAKAYMQQMVRAGKNWGK